MLTIRSEHLFRLSRLNLQASAGTPGPSLLHRAGSAIWHGLEKVGKARARRDLRQLADQYALCSPSFAAELRAASRFDDESPTLVGGYRTGDSEMRPVHGAIPVRAS